MSINNCGKNNQRPMHHLGNIISNKLIMVEGNDDCLVIDTLLNFMGIEDVQIIILGGTSEYSKRIRLLQEDDEYENTICLGFIRDADNSYDRAFQSITNVLTRLGIEYPSNANEFIDNTAGDKKIGIYIMPKLGMNGMLEDLLNSSAETTDRMQYVKDFMEEIRVLDNPPNNPAKAQSMAYLSTMRDYLPKVGLAAQRGIWDFYSPVFDELKAFLEEFRF